MNATQNNDEKTTQVGPCPASAAGDPTLDDQPLGDVMDDAEFVTWLETKIEGTER